MLCFILLFAICYIKTLLVNVYEFIKAWTEISLRMKYINITSWIIFGWSFLLCCTLSKPSCKYIIMFVSNRNVIWIIYSIPQKSPFSVVNKGVDIVMPFACILMCVCVCLFSCLSQRNREGGDCHRCWIYERVMKHPWRRQTKQSLCVHANTYIHPALIREDITWHEKQHKAKLWN